MSVDLGFGYGRGVPDGVKAAWGCRLIVNQGGHVDFVHDRQGFYDGDPPQEHAGDAVGAWVNTIFGLVLDKVREKLRAGELDTRKAEHVELWRDDRGVIVANTNASAGYLYVAAWLLVDVPQEAA